MKLRFSKASRQDLKAIYLQSEALFGRQQADAYAAGLAGAFAMIADYPLASRLRHETDIPVRARPFRSHVILYVIEEPGVLILRMRHGHEDWHDDPFSPPARSDTP